jgi:hypothetical protein
MQLELNMGVHTVAPFEDKSATDMFFKGLPSCYDDYTAQFSTLKDGRINGTAMKMQRTDPGGGYHVWHGEQGNGEHAHRVLVYMLYLNGLGGGEGGETEFLYQSKRISAKKGRLIIFPPNYPWTHRGNPPLSGEKYIMTGWVEFR